jgi:glycosyltransferase involved in cell wall biosynthesis
VRLLVDGRPALGGVERMTRGLVDGLRRALPEGELVVYAGRGEGGPSTRLPRWRRVARAVGGGASHILTDQVTLPRVARRHGVDLFHCPGFQVIPRRIGVPGVVTLYDLSLVDYLHTKRRSPISGYERWAFLDAARGAAHLVTISETVRRELVARLGLAEGRVTRIYPEIPQLERLPAPPELPPEAAGAFLLSVGTLEPRKNLDRLLEAHRLVWSELRVPLLLVGGYGWSQRAVVRRVAAAGGAVRWLGRVEDAVLAELYRRASAVVQYSVYEGFDLPLAEALACGTPVLASDLAVHHEVAGECGVYVSATRPAELARAIAEVVAWPRDRRRSHGEAAARRVVELRREDPIARHLDVYQRVLADSIRGGHSIRTVD